MPVTNNQDICGIVKRLDRFVLELNKSVSSSTSQMNIFDQNRLSSYLASIIAYHDFMVGLPQLDLPESSPTVYTLPEAVASIDVENESVNDLIRMLNVARVEVINCQSSRDPASLNKYDSARFVAIINKCQLFLKDYIATITPIDFPESSPSTPSSGGGKTGI